jgi:hypothetical protein
MLDAVGNLVSSNHFDAFALSTNFVLSCSVSLMYMCYRRFVAVVLVVWSVLTLLLLLHTLLLDLSRTAFTKDGVTFSDREEYEAALADTSHPVHNAANARATDAINRGEDRDSRTMLSALYHDQVW